MAFGELRKNKNFVTGFLIGIVLTLGRAWVSMLELVLRPIFELWSRIWSPGLVLEIIPLYISGLIIFVIIWWLFLRGQNGSSLAVSIKLFSFGFLSSFILFLLLAIIAISQFEFAQ